MKAKADLNRLHKKSRHNRSFLSESTVCGCFYCFKEFPFAQIKSWIDDNKTALCPYCGIDAVLGFDSILADQQLLQEMHEHWFKSSIRLRSDEWDNALRANVTIAKRAAVRHSMAEGQKSASRVVLSSPNMVPWTLFGMLQRLAVAPSQAPQSPELVQQNALSAIFIAVAAVEAFTNIFFRVIAEEPQFYQGREAILKAIKSKHSTSRKLKEWTHSTFGREIDQEDERWKSFQNLVARRNELVHFKLSYDSIGVSNVHISGLADTSQFLQLAKETPRECLNCAVGIVELIGRSRGISQRDMRGFLHGWIGVLSE